MSFNTEITVIWYRFNETKKTLQSFSLYPDHLHNSDVIMSSMASQITGIQIVYLTIYSGADQRKHQRSMWLTFVRRIHQWVVDCPHKGPATWKIRILKIAIRTSRKWLIRISGWLWIHYVWILGPCLPQVKISTTCAISIWRNNRKSKCIFMAFNSLWSSDT